MTNASIILAKRSGYKFVTSYNSFSDERKCRIAAPVSCFADYKFDPDPQRYLPHVTKSPGEPLKFKYAENYDYEPKAYPYHEVAYLASKSIIDTIEELETFPEANHKSIFDHYIVLVPSIYFPSISDKGIFTFLNPQGFKESSKDRIEANRMLDMFFILKKIVSPILLGEKDGKCYYICEWK